MKLVIAKTAGFCMGVRRAVEMVLSAPGRCEGPIYTYGPLIHNPQVLEMLREKGIFVLGQIPAQGTGTVLIRAHGVPPETRRQLEEAGFTVIDATCPRVIKVQSIIRKHAGQGYATLIVGDRDHPEVVGLLGYAGASGRVVSRMADLEALPAFERAIIVAQTTQNKNFFDAVRQWAAAHHPHYKVFDTICDSTARRQEEVRRLAEEADALVVVGGRSSGNTRRLAEIAAASGKPTVHVETEAELDADLLAGARSVAVTAGASTPNWIIKRVCRRLETLPVESGGTWSHFCYHLQQTLLRTNTYVAVGAGSLCYACIQLQRFHRILPLVLLAALYVQSMHVLNNLTGQQEDRYNDPGRAHFYQRHRFALALLALVSGGLGLLMALWAGTKPFAVLAVMSLLGLSYSLNLVPARLGWRIRRIRDLPGSKTVLIALAWATVAVLLPALAQNGRIDAATLLVFAICALLVFARTAFFDILDVQGDRIVGKETLPVVLGEAVTLRLLKASLILAAAGLALGALSGLTSPLAVWLLACPLFLYLVFSAYTRGRIHPGVRLEFLIETNFVMAGILAFFWTLVT
ncbi:MAG: 4-hydroxy-3-methylbut-2-enyl diphosphate reductase [Deltaproteobacteria bacterium]|nr:4-hydroxy-3-methylbut-2-enyl diphosphate reductase [Deltaproteobacteria bacterium]MBW2356747.1 4-hydroxy-3-methylbut-2-enyl diphosphate reductase [Deltaproteobacteria bacterium]RLB98126.1 MAG: 4-hydroxy-3-methylbut-2-enyl diphosphate reductase [Deltaproteobacteria bacterium]